MHCDFRHARASWSTRTAVLVRRDPLGPPGVVWVIGDRSGPESDIPRCSRSPNGERSSTPWIPSVA